MQNMIVSFKKSFPEAPSDFWDNFVKEVNVEELTSLIIPIYDKNYSDEDINQLIQFYQSPLGKKVISSMPQIMQESMQAGQVWGEKIGTKVVENLKDKGYYKGW